MENEQKGLKRSGVGIGGDMMFNGPAAYLPASWELFNANKGNRFSTPPYVLHALRGFVYDH